MLRKVFTALVGFNLIFAFVFGVAGSARAAEAWQGSLVADRCSVEQGQLYIDVGSYKQAIREFTCIIDAQPTEVEGYRGRIEAELLLGRYSDAVLDYTRVTALVEPVHPDAAATIYAGYNARLSIEPENIPALTGASFARWWFFNYAQAIQILNRLLSIRPDDLYGNLFRGSSRLLLGPSPASGMADLEYALALAPLSADVRYIVADAYFYGRSDYLRAFNEATLALEWGLDTPRVHAILGGAYLSFGDMTTAATHIERHIELVTSELVPAAPLEAGASLALDLVPYQTYQIPIPVVAGETISIITISHDFTDSIIVLLAPDGSPVVGSDDFRVYFAGFEWTAGETGTYQLLATSFEAVSTGVLKVTRR